MVAALVPARSAMSPILVSNSPRSYRTSAAAATICGLRRCSIFGRGLTGLRTPSKPAGRGFLNDGSRNYLRLGLCVKAAIVVAVLCVAAPASAGQLTSRSLPQGCDEDTDGVIAFACDPARQAGPAQLVLGTKAARGHLDGAEPLQPGETLTLTWSHPSSRAILYLDVTAPTGARGLIVNLRGGAER